MTYCKRCNQQRPDATIYRGICASCRLHSCTTHDRGTPVCYTYCGCRCGRCSRAARRREASRELSRARGFRPLIDATGTKRRIRALQAIGWTCRDIASVAGIDPRALSQYLRRDSLHHTTVKRISAAYDRLCMAPGRSSLNRQRAVANGWSVPLAWDDGTGPHGIDNPSATPYAVNKPDKKQVSKARLEDVQELAEQGYTRHQIAARLGLEPKTLERFLARKAA